jgi:Ras-related protein Rab-1A
MKSEEETKNTSKFEYDHLFKILLIGNSNVGKSSLFIRFVDNEWKENFIPTIGVDFKIKSIKIDNKTIKLQIWDTAGQERFKSILSSYYKGANGILLLYDITNINSFKNLSSWLIEIEKNSTKNVKKILIGNKCDLNELRKISTNQGKEFADTYNMKFIETSAKNNININECFYILGKELIKNLDLKLDKKDLKFQLNNNNNIENEIFIDKDDNVDKSGGCC